MKGSGVTFNRTAALQNAEKVCRFQSALTIGGQATRSFSIGAFPKFNNSYLTTALACGGDVFRISKRNAPELGRAIESLWKKLKLLGSYQQLLPVLAYDDSLCSQKTDAQLATNPQTQARMLAVRLESLLSYPDDMQKGTYAHELFHYKQETTNPGNNNNQTGISKKTKNNFEVEADLASMLMLRDPCWRFRFDDDEVLTVIPQITTRNVHTVIVGQSSLDFHPTNIRRKLMMVQMYEGYKEAEKALGV